MNGSRYGSPTPICFTNLISWPSIAHSFSNKGVGEGGGTETVWFEHAESLSSKQSGERSRPRIVEQNEENQKSRKLQGKNDWVSST